MGSKPTQPMERKRLNGFPSHRVKPPAAVRILERVEGVPEPSRPLDAAGLDMWRRVWNAGANWVSPETDIELLLSLCEQVDERVGLRLRVLQFGDKDDRKGLRDLDRAILTASGALGFTPSDRSRLGLAEVRAVSKLEELRRGATRA